MADSPHQLDYKVLQNHKDTLPSLVESLTRELYEGILILDGSQQIIFVNQAAELLLGCTRDNLTRQALGDIFSPDQIDLLFNSNGQNHRFFTHLQTADGRSLPASITITALPFTVEGLTLASIMALPQADEWTEKLIHNERLAGLGTMGASIAHELINPISVIATTTFNMAEMVASKSVDLEEMGRYLSMIDTNVGRSVRLIRTLQAYTYGETMREPTAINELIEHAVTLMGAQIEKQDNLRLNFELNPELPKVTCDPGQITQVLVNLILNARDAMLPGGGEIKLKTWSIPEMASVAVSVQDSGKGLSGEQIPRLFDPFFTTKKRGEGTGLGLFIVSEIIKQHNGWIRAQNRVESDDSVSGALFTVMLPV